MSQIAVLKENVAKADLEIAELDKLIDHMREVCMASLCKQTVVIQTIKPSTTYGIKTDN